MDANGWIALATGGLVIVTLVYVVITWKIARHAAASADAARDSASAAAEAAEATRRAASIAEANLPVAFRAEYGDPIGGTSAGTLRIICEGSRLYVHGASLLGVVHDSEHGEQPHVVRGELQLVKPATDIPGLALQDLPALLHKDDPLAFRWPGSPVRTDKTNVAYVTIRYSIDPDEAAHEISKSVEFPQAPQIW